MCNKEMNGWILGILFALLFGWVFGLLIGKSVGYKQGQIDYAQGIRRYIVVGGHVLKFVDKINMGVE